MLYQDNVLKNNWPFQRGELYVIDYKRGQRPRESKLEISVLLWPKKQSDTTKWFMVVPITLDITGRDPETDLVIHDMNDIKKPYAVNLVHAHMVAEHQLLAYVGKISDKSVNRIIRRMQDLLAEFCEISSG